MPDLAESLKFDDLADLKSGDVGKCHLAFFKDRLQLDFRPLDFGVEVLGPFLVAGRHLAGQDLAQALAQVLTQAPAQVQ